MNFIKNDIQRWRAFKRLVFYQIERFEYFRLEECRQSMLKIKMENKEDLKKSAGSTQWAFYLKKRL